MMVTRPRVSSRFRTRRRCSSLRGPHTTEGPSLLSRPTAPSLTPTREQARPLRRPAGHLAARPLSGRLFRAARLPPPNLLLPPRHSSAPPSRRLARRPRRLARAALRGAVAELRRPPSPPDGVARHAAAVRQRLRPNLDRRGEQRCARQQVGLVQPAERLADQQRASLRRVRAAVWDAISSPLPAPLSPPLSPPLSSTGADAAPGAGGEQGAAREGARRVKGGAAAVDGVSSRLRL